MFIEQAAIPAGVVVVCVSNPRVALVNGLDVSAFAAGFFDGFAGLFQSDDRKIACLAAA
jgi:hypothetical protein